MALIDKKLTDLTEKLSVPDDAFIHIVDVSDTSQSPEGSSYKARKSTISGTVKAQTGVSGTVKTNTNSSDPIVYLTTEVDSLVAGKQNALGFTPENVANKQSNLDEDLSGLKYPNVTAVKSGLSTKADITALNLKADKSNTYTKLEVDNLIEEVDLSTKENTDNKQNSLSVDGTGVKFPTVDAVRTHTTDTNNPHAVTKAQVGLANVDNTSDLNKPISTATQTALNAKQNEISGTTNVIPKFGTGGLISSNITDNGTLVSTSTDMTVNGLRVGRGGGNISTNVAIGIGAFNANSTGAGNLAIGESALFLNQTGNDNIGIGVQALRNSVGAIRNIGVGATALRANTSGGANTAIGFRALEENTTGGNNLAVGIEAGKFIADGTTMNAITNNSIYLGAFTRALANNQTNQIVIGTSGIGLGSNTTVIGNTSTTFGRWFGRLLLGTSTDNGTDALQTPLTISHAPAVSANQGVVKSQLDLKADLASPALTGVPTAPTATAGTNTTQIATTAFVQANTNANAVLLTGNQTVSGRKTFNSDNTTLGGIVVNNSRTTSSFFGETFGLSVINTSLAGIYAENSTAVSTGDALRIVNSSNTGNGISLTNFSSGIGISLRKNGASTGDLLNAEVGVTRIQSTGRLSTTLAPVSGNDVVNKTYVDTKSLYTNQTITANKTVTIAEFVNNNELILSVDATSGNTTITLPTFTALQGYKVTVKKMDSSANSVLITGVGGINIDGASTLIISGQYGTATVGANLSQYIIL